MNIYLMKKPKKINTFSVTLFLIIVIGGYLGWFFLPAWLPIFKLKGIMRGTCYDMYRIFDNEKLEKALVKNAKRVGLKVTNENFQLLREPYTDQELLDLKVTAQMRMTMTRRGKNCRIRFRYTDNTRTS